MNYAKVVREVHKVWFGIDNSLDFVYTFALYRSERLARGTILERNHDKKHHISDAAGGRLYKCDTLDCGDQWMRCSYMHFY